MLSKSFIILNIHIRVKTTHDFSLKMLQSKRNYSCIFVHHMLEVWGPQIDIRTLIVVQCQSFTLFEPASITPTKLSTSGN